MTLDAEGKYVDAGRRKDKGARAAQNASGAALWIPGLLALVVSLAGLLFVRNIFLGQMLMVIGSLGGSFIAAGCVVSAVRDRTHGRSGRPQ